MGPNNSFSRQNFADNNRITVSKTAGFALGIFPLQHKVDLLIYGSKGYTLVRLAQQSLAARIIRTNDEGDSHNNV